MDDTERELRAASERLHGQYGARFAGRSRLTRDRDTIRRMAREATVLRERAEAAHGASSSVVAELRERESLYASEAEAVTRAQAEAGVAGIEAAALAREANHWFAVYGRHFAGQARTTRDMERLEELLAGLRDVERRMAAAEGALNAENLGIVRERLKAYGAEVEEIERARDALGPDDQAGVLGGRANVLFGVWDRQFAGLPRLSRRPERLEALVRGLREVRDRMRRLPAPSAADRVTMQARNLDIVEERLGLYEQELAAVRQARETTALEQLLEALAAEVQAVMAVWDREFAGQARKTRDQGLIDGLCDRMMDVEMQLGRLGRRFETDALQAQWSLCRDLRDLLEDEAARIREARGESA